MYLDIAQRSFEAGIYIENLADAKNDLDDVSKIYTRSLEELSDYLGRQTGSVLALTGAANSVKIRTGERGWTQVATGFIGDNDTQRGVFGPGYFLIHKVGGGIVELSAVEDPDFPQAVSEVTLVQNATIDSLRVVTTEEVDAHRLSRPD